MKKILCRTVLLFAFFIFNVKCYALSSDFTYEIENNSATITSYIGSSETITIPSTIDGYQVKKIANHAFNPNRSNGNSRILKKVIISEGITTLGDFSFANCPNLESIKLPESLTSLGDQTFIGCKNLNKINIPSKITTLGYSGYMFQETAFTEFTIPENVKNIPSSTFRICPNLKKVIVYSNDLRYGQNTFEYCSTSLVLYGNEGSTTQTYAQQNGLQFKLISNQNENISVSSITLNKSSLSLYVGNMETLSATISPSNATDKTIIWSSSNTNVATVTNGKITAKNAGSTVITVSTPDGTKKAKCNVTVTKKEESVNSESINPNVTSVTSITLNKNSLSLYVGDTETLLATISPSDATDKTIIWSSSNTNIATVTNGKITAKNAGSTIITASTPDGTKKAKCNVTVTKKEESVNSESINPNVTSVTSITLNKNSLSLYVGDTETLSAIISPSNATDKTIIWSSSNTDVATVANGKITAKNAGSTIITASTPDGTKKAESNITVINKSSFSGSSQDDIMDDNNPQKKSYGYIIPLAVLLSIFIATFILMRKKQFTKPLE